MRSRGLAAGAAAGAWLMFSASPGAAQGAGRITGTVDRSLMADPSNAIVYVEDMPGRTFPPPAEPAVMEQRFMQFIPHVLPILQGTTVRFPNDDRVRHNVFSPSAAKPFNFGIYYPHDARQLTFDNPGVVTLLCNIHEQMSAYIVVLQNPYFVRVSPDGTFAIDDVPEGRYSVALWSERATDRRRRPVTVRAGSVVASFAGE